MARRPCYHTRPRRRGRTRARRASPDRDLLDLVADADAVHDVLPARDLPEVRVLVVEPRRVAFHYKELGVVVHFDVRPAAYPAPPLPARQALHPARHLPPPPPAPV